MNRRLRMLVVLALLLSSAAHAAADLPNILWINAEDIGPALGCYDHPDAITPNLDGLAKDGILFRNAFATAPICAPARSCLITGLYATSLGTQHLRSEVKRPAFVKTIPEHLRTLGYYCASSWKTDYNFDPAGVWDERASGYPLWRKRGKDQPFFAMVTLGITHEGPVNHDEQSASAIEALPQELRRDPRAIHLPPYWPDSPGTRAIWARQHNLITVMDRQVGEILDLLKEDGLEESTIVFFFGDHGYGLPRAKRWLSDSGLRVPLIVRIPERLRSDSSAAAGSEWTSPVSFVDFAPTVLSLAGLETPAVMQGRAFLGTYAAAPRRLVFGARSRADDMFECSRSVYDGRHIYIRHYLPHLPYIQGGKIYSDEKASYRELRRLYRAGQLTPEAAVLWRSSKPIEELYDLKSDPHELKNLAESGTHAHVIEGLRAGLREWILEARDTGFLTESEYQIRAAAAGTTPYEVARDRGAYPLERVLATAELVGDATVPADTLLARLEDEDSGVRYWAATALRARGELSEPVKEALEKHLADASPSVRIAAAEALSLGFERAPAPALEALARQLRDERPWVSLEAARATFQIEGRARPLVPVMREVIDRNRSPSGSERPWKDFNYAAFTTWALEAALEICEAEPDPAKAQPDWTAHPIDEWVRQSPRPDVPAPPLKYEGSGDFDPGRERWIHFAGHDGIPQGFHLLTCDLKTGVWRQHFPNTSPPGVCCVDGSNVFDVASDRFVAFPGGSLGHGYQWSRSVKLKSSNVWLYDPGANTWTDMRPPPYARPEKYSRDIIGGLNSSATYDSDHEVTISFGGQGAGGPTNALFVYDAYSNHLEQRHPPEAPSQRDGAGLCWDSRRKMLVLFGSQYSDDERTWTYRFETNRWEAHELDPHPPGRKEGTYSTNPKMAFDEANGVCLCVVRRGEKSGRPTGTLETWVLDSAAMEWKRMEPAARPDPSASRARNLGYWPEQNLFVLETVAADHTGPQIWTYRYRVPAAPMRPRPPAGLRVVTSGEGAELSWDPGSSEDVKSYRVYRADAERAWEARFEKIGSTTGESYRDEGLARQAVYRYRVAAVNGDGEESRAGRSARTQPRVLPQPVVSVLAADRVEVSWRAHPDGDIAGYNVYRALAKVETVRRGTQAAWRDNDPEYEAPVVVGVSDIEELRRLNPELLDATTFADDDVDLSREKLSSPDYRYAVYAYVVRAVNRLGVESGPSPYALTIPSTPEHVLLREQGDAAEIRWAPNPEKGIAGYRLYKLGKSHWEILRVNEHPVRETTFRHAAGGSTTRYWLVAIDSLGQEGQPSSAVWYRHAFEGFFEGEWHQ